MDNEKKQKKKINLWSPSPSDGDYNQTRLVEEEM